MEKEENIFDSAEVSEELCASSEDYSEDENIIGTWTPTISSESPKEKKERLGVKKEMDGKTLTVKSYFFTKPRMMNRDGTKIEPKKSQTSDALYYSAKLGIKFVEENLVEYYPSFNYFLDDKGNVSQFAKINRNGDNAISKIFQLILAKKGIASENHEEISDQAALDFLVGKQVKVKTAKGNYLGKPWFRNDIIEIL